ncbi:hypothetical protein ES703_79322 [subsurface metagenome]
MFPAIFQSFKNTSRTWTYQIPYEKLEKVTELLNQCNRPLFHSEENGMYPYLANLGECVSASKPGTRC